jgi:tetratricopeptide (TPR) repeat protein
VGSAERAVQDGRLRTAKYLYERALAAYPQHRPLLHYNLGYCCEQKMADGEAARAHYQLAIESRIRAEGIIPKMNIDLVEANACENLMLLSLSYDEYEKWASCLEQLQPGEEILHVQRVHVREMNERGLPWWRALDAFCDNYYSFTDQRRNPGLYAKAAATYGLVIMHRHTLRVPPDEYRRIVGLYGSLVGKACAEYGEAMGRSRAGVDFSEIREMVRRALAIIEKCTDEVPGDVKMKELRTTLERMNPQMDDSLGKPQQGSIA